MSRAPGDPWQREARRGRRGSREPGACLAQPGLRVPQAQRFRDRRHCQFRGHRGRLGLQVRQGRMVPQEGTVSRATLVKMENPVKLGPKASPGPQETWAPRVRRGTLGSGQEDPQGLRGLRGHQDPPSDTTS